ncbi:N-hydroxyarylamine O-acetyltransferase [Amycolatopsis xylanica]|uniref:N-hydroxyarylamine O-acetyltransferase n=1 Tax=Amycolatopsis xylanica TaxID=589385 RepID=A0A1H3ACI7_9PSEU|nr:arylamine N-acetyltransferase [Amycolatopsis xylanica]SDX26579.1 N-hydroxyarylamine O-acetyltransferase [Amycolatopsis xylanica]
MNFDLDAYLTRIGHARVTPSAEALESLHEAHVRSIPFENLDVVMGTHAGIGLGVIQDKLVRRQRGGYCYEHGLLFAAALEALGFTVERRMARVQPDRPGPSTHMMLVVRIGDDEFLADVGFGWGLLRSMPLRDQEIVDQSGWKYRLLQNGPWWRLQRFESDWTTLHQFGPEVRYQVDYEVGHHYVSTHPKSPFWEQIVVMRLEPGLSKRFVGNELILEYADGRVEKSIVTRETLDETLRGLDVVVTPNELAKIDTLR